MKFLIRFSVLWIGLGIYAQDIKVKNISSEVSEVTVFLEGAQILREKSVSLPKGEHVLKFKDLSPFIDAKSLQVKAEGELVVLSVNHQQNYLNELDKSAELTKLEEQLEAVEEKMQLETTYLNIVKQELAFLEGNSDIGGRNEDVSISNLQQVSNFYSKKLTELKLKELERDNNLVDLKKEWRGIEKQIKTISSVKEYPSGEVLIKVDAKKPNTFKFELKYLVANASWFPTYDIRAKNIEEPINLVYKANVKQDTKVDWNNVKLTFSTGEPNVSGLAPELQPYYLNYNTLPPNFKSNISTVQGTVLDDDGLPVPGVNVIVKGTSIGATTDFDGRYSITIPNNAQYLVFSYVGFKKQEIPIAQKVINVNLVPDTETLDEVVVVGYGSRNKRRDKVSAIESVQADASIPIATAQVENQTTVNFEIEIPYTIKSDNKSYAVEMDAYSLPADYQYYSVPKIDKDAFLLANIIDWEKYNLLEGEANVFFEGTYVGKTLLDVRFATDTLQVSLGRDKQVSVNREKIKEYTDKQFIGSKKEDTRAWKISVKNNKSQKINMIILDQVPVSVNDEIQIKIEEISKAKVDEKTGEVKWIFGLEPKAEKILELKYNVKYPKNRRVILE